MSKEKEKKEVDLKKEECEHKNVEKFEHYYGNEDYQYYTFWSCLDCGDEMEDE